MPKDDYGYAGPIYPNDDPKMLPSEDHDSHAYWFCKRCSATIIFDGLDTHDQFHDSLAELWDSVVS